MSGVSGALERLRSLKAAKRVSRVKGEKEGRDAAHQPSELDDAGCEHPMDSATSVPITKRAKLNHEHGANDPLHKHGSQADLPKRPKSDSASEPSHNLNGGSLLLDHDARSRKCEDVMATSETVSPPEGVPSLVQDIVQDLRECKQAIDEKLRAALARVGGEYDLQETEGSNTSCLDSARQITGDDGKHTKRSREKMDGEQPGETLLYGQRHQDLFVGERPFRIDVSTVSSRMIITAQRIHSAKYTNKMHRETYVYGNYPNYYGVRLGDNRIEAFEEEWFRGRDCIDVGCHEGIFTLQIVTKFLPKSMIGIDIDRNLVLKKGRVNLKMELSKARSDEAATATEKEEKKAVVKALNNTRFFVGDYAAKEGAPECIDTVTCFSVIKWIHFHHGDDGIKFVFRKIFNSLRPGGVFILEPQAFESYQKAKRKQNMCGVPFYDLTLLKLRPTEFLDHLVNEVGFKHVTSLAFPDAKKGFARPIFVLRKPESFS